MNRLSHSLATSLDHLLEIYSEKSPEVINSFIEKRYTRFEESDPKPTYLDVWISRKNEQQMPRDIATKEEFIYQCIKLGIDPYYYNTIVQSFTPLNSSQYALLLNYEIQEMRTGKSNFHIIQRMIRARKNCLKNIKSILEEVMKQSIARLSELDKLCMQMIQIRMITLILVETIYDWYYSIGTLFEDGIKQNKYQHNEIDVFNQICEDTDFLRGTVLKKYLKFARGFDPLLIRITRRRKQEVSHKVNDADRFGDFFQPDFNILSRLRQAEAVLIKHYSTRTFPSQQLRGTNDMTNLKPTQAKREPFYQIKSISETKHIEPEDVLETEHSRFELRKLKSERKQCIQQPRQVGYIKRFTPKANLEINSTKTTKQIQQRTKDQSVSKRAKQTNIMEKIKLLKQQLRNNSYLQNRFKDERARYNTEPNEEDIFEKKDSIKSVYKMLPTLLDRKIQPISYNRKRVSEKTQKIKFLRHIYRDNTKSDLQMELKIIKTRVSETVKKRKKDRRGENINFKVCRDLQQRCVSFDKFRQRSSP